MKPRYYVFWTEDYEHDSDVFDDLDPVLALVKKCKDAGDWVCVIKGVALEFEPATVVQTYKVKE